MIGPAKSLTRFRSLVSRGASSTRKLGGTDWSIVFVTLMLFDAFIPVPREALKKLHHRFQQTSAHIAMSARVDN